MLRLSKLADYGTVIMVYLAKYPNKLCNARDIAIHTHLTQPTVSKLLKKLTAANLLVSVRGVSGGYRLQRAAATISVVDIIHALKEQMGLTSCSVHPSHCRLHPVCHIQQNWQLISQAIETALTSVSLDILAKPTLAATEIERIKQLASGVHRG